MKCLFGLRELRADQQRHDPAGEEEEPGRGDVEDPDPLVVGRDSQLATRPRCQAGMRRLGVNRHRAPPSAR